MRTPLLPLTAEKTEDGIPYSATIPSAQLSTSSWYSSDDIGRTAKYAIVYVLAETAGKFARIYYYDIENNHLYTSFTNGTTYTGLDAAEDASIGVIMRVNPNNPNIVDYKPGSPSYIANTRFIVC